MLHKYMLNSTVCIIWHDDFELNLVLANERYDAAAIVNIHLHALEASFAQDVVNFTATRERLLNNYVVFDAFVQKLVMSIESTHCECFIAFQADIPIFIEAFINASRYSIWRSTRNKFIFAYNVDERNDNYFLQHFFTAQPNILVLERNTTAPHIFKLKTNKFVGPRAEQPEQLYLLDRYNASSDRFDNDAELFPDKLLNLRGREVILGAFDYRPDVIFKYYPGAPNRDLAFAATDPAGDVEIDGTEARILMTFCEKYNCTLVIDSTESDDWGIAYMNMTGESTLGMLAKGKAEVGMSAMYTWYVDYLALDMSVYLGRSGITCVVPAPKRLASWLLPVEPFQADLWGFVIACLCIEVLALLVMRHFERLADVRAAAPQKELSAGQSWTQHLKFALSTTLKLFISQPNSDKVRFVPLRVMLFACFLNDIVITSIYGGGLASILTVPSFEQAADSLERMYAFKLKWAADSTAWADSIRDDDSEIIKSVLANFHVYSEEELALLAPTTHMGFTIERLPFGHFAVQEHLTRDVLDRMKIMVDDIYFQYTVAFTARLWPMLERFNAMIYMWHSSGFDKFWEWRNVADNLDGHIQKQLAASMYVNMDDIGPVKLGMSNFAGIILLWVLGICLALFVFAMELLLQRVQLSAHLPDAVARLLSVR